MSNEAVFRDRRWETFGLFRESYLAVSARIDAEVREIGGLEPSIADVLFRLARTPSQTLRAVDIARALSTSTSRTTRLLDEAQELGLIARKAHASDRRAINVVLTSHGLNAARAAGRVALDAAQRHLHDRLTPEETREFERLLRKVREA